MARIRSKNLKKVRRDAHAFLKEALGTKSTMDNRKAVNAHWLKHANLMPVFEYLAGQI